MNALDHKKNEEKWKKHWFENNIYEAVDFSEKPKKYILAELPYPSGKSLHIGHAMRYTVPEIYSRYLRMCGFNVLFPMGWDAFGLPTEGFALKSGKSPQDVTLELGESYKQAMMDIGYAIDWNRCFSTTDPEYYKWTQWLFLKFYEHGLAVQREMPVWWCKELGNLADEEILTDSEGNKIAERGGYKVERKLFKQWVLKIPEYAEKLLEGLKHVDFPEAIKNAQINWIGKSEGAEISFSIKEKDIKLSVFTTRPDTLFGVTFLAISPEHTIIEQILPLIENKKEVLEFISKTKNMSNLERQKVKEKEGIELKGIKVLNPVHTENDEIPVYIANYVVMDYGSGIIMGVPAHDERDNEFAKKYALKSVQVIDENDKMVNCGNYDGISKDTFFYNILEKLEKEKCGKRLTIYKIRDWVFSRQHYWGEPIPVVFTQEGTVEAIVKTDDTEEVNRLLPLELPYSMDYEPLPDGSAPLAKLTDWINTQDKKGKPAKRETQTMPTWAGSSWYYLRYIDPQNNDAFADSKKLEYWLPVDKYFGGAEHTTVHLLYSRFWHKFFYDIGIVPTPEPYSWRLNGGLLLASDGRKMSKRFGNVVEPGELIQKFGADATRLALAFLGPYEDTYPWNDNSVKTMNKFIKTIYNLSELVNTSEPDLETKKKFNKAVKNITEMMENLKLNTCVSELMILVNHMKKLQSISIDMWKDFLKLLAPFAPFTTEELWYQINNYKMWKKEYSIHLQNWPAYNKDLTIDDTLTIPVQINGKVRSEIIISRDDTENKIKTQVLDNDKVKAHIGKNEIKKLIYVKNKIINIVI